MELPVRVLFLTMPLLISRNERNQSVFKPCFPTLNKMREEFTKVMALGTETWENLVARMQVVNGPLHADSDKRAPACRLWGKLEPVVPYQACSLALTMILDRARTAEQLHLIALRNSSNYPRHGVARIRSLRVLRLRGHIEVLSFSDTPHRSSRRPSREASWKKSSPCSRSS